MSYEDDHRELGKRIDDLCAKRAFAPHCDQWVLHAPDTCWSCDGYPDWQSARLTWGINFTGESDPEKLPCPAELRRPVDTINRWGGNRPDGQTFDDYLTEVKRRAKEFGDSRGLIAPVAGEDYSVTVAKHFGVEIATPVYDSRLQRARRRLRDLVHYHL